MPGLDKYLNRKRPSIEAIRERVDLTEASKKKDKETTPDKTEKEAGKESEKEAGKDAGKESGKEVAAPKTKTIEMPQRPKEPAGRKPLSPTSIALFLECPRCFWMERNRQVKRPSGPFPSLPNGMDRILKSHFDLHRGDNTPPEELEGKFPGRLFQDMEKLRVWRNNYRGLRWTDPKSGITLMGAIDDLFVTADGRYAPLDFKTRGYPRKEDTHAYYLHQMDIYSFLLEKNHMPPADYAILIFYHPTGVNPAHDVIFDPDPVKVPVDRDHGERIFLDAVKCLLSPVMPEPSRGCQWCSWIDKNK